MSWDIATGTEFAGYRITGVLGRGGMSVVYSAEHLGLDRTIALKVLSPSLGTDEDFRERFVRESRLAATLEHPNIIPIFDAGEADGALYIAMRYVEGGDLGSLIKSDAPLGIGRTIFFIEQIAGALDHAHRRGLVHRDVKPANILIAKPSERAYLTDFGVVKETSTAGLTKTGYFLGTFAYAAPEQIERRPVDGRTDLYALGCVLHECLSGKPPFDAVTEASILHAHLAEPPPRLTDARPDLPHAIDDVIATALAKAQEDRYATCGELVKALRAVALDPVAQEDDAGLPGLAGKPVAATVLSKADDRAPAPQSIVAEPPVVAPPSAPPPAEQPPSAEPPPREPVGAPAGAASPPREKTPRTFTLSARALAALGAGVLLIVAGAVLGAVLLSRDDGGAQATPTGPATTSTATQTDTTSQSVVASGVSGVIPNAILKFCTDSAPTLGATEAVDCRPAAGGGSGYYPDSARILLFASATALQQAYDRLRRTNGVRMGFGQCNGISWGGEGKWDHGPDKPGGSRFCYFDGDDAVVVWTHDKLGQPSHVDLLAIARSSGSDHSNLYNWYRFWHHRLGKCDAPGCVARL